MGRINAIVFRILRLGEFFPTISGVCFIEITMSGVCFIEITMSGVRFIEITMSGVRFIEITLWIV